jgi:hypothetical protein
VLNWWPVIAGPAGVVASAVGIAQHHKVGGWWLAVAGLALLSFVLLAAVYRLHKLQFPDFPPHKVKFGKPWIIEDPKEDGKKLLFIDAEYVNRDERKAHITLDVLWQLEWKTRYKKWQMRKRRRDQLVSVRLWPYRGTLGSLALFPQPAVVAAEDREDGAVVVSLDSYFGEVGEQGETFQAPEDRKFFVHMTDDLSGAETIVPLDVPEPEEVEKVVAERGTEPPIEAGVALTGNSLRVSFTNDGDERIPANQLLNVFVPRSVRVFQPTDEHKQPIVSGEVSAVDEGDTDWGQPHWVWKYRTAQDMIPGAIRYFYFQFEADPGEYSISVRIPGYGKENFTVEAEAAT